MSQNQYLPFATGDGANTMTAAQYASIGPLSQGFTSGIALSIQANTLFRQLSTVAAMIGQFTADNQAADVLDNGAVATLEAQFGTALKGYLSDSSVHYGIATGTGDAMAVTASPPVQTTTAGAIRTGTLLFVLTPASANASTSPTLNVSQVGNIAVAKRNETALAANDIPASSVVGFLFDGTHWVVVGLAPSDALAAIPATALWHRALDTSASASLIQAAAAPPVTSATRLPGTPYLVIPAHACAGTTTIDVGFGAQPLTRWDGTAVVSGDYPANEPLLVVDDGQLFRIVGLTAAQVLALIAQNAPIITPSAILYVRPDGNDANTGLANTPAGAFQTIAAAIAYGTRAYYFPGGQLTIQLGLPGSYAAPNTIQTGAGSILVQGDVTNQAAYVLTGSGPSAGSSGIFSPTNCTVTVQGVTLQNTGTGNGNLFAGNNAVCNVSYVTFTNAVGGNNFSSITAINNGTVVVGPGCIFAGSCGGLLNTNHGTIVLTADLTLQGTPNFSIATAQCSQGGSITRAPTNPNFVGSGATGTRYSASLNGVITTFGGGANYFPGNAAGVLSNGGQYA